MVQTGTSEKVAAVVQYISTFITAFAIAYARNWRLALALTSIFPVIVTAGVLINVFGSKLMQ